MNKLKKLDVKFTVAHPIEDALFYIEKVIKMKEQWPMDRLLAVKKILADLDVYMVELTGKIVDHNVLDEEK